MVFLIPGQKKKRDAGFSLSFFRETKQITIAAGVLVLVLVLYVGLWVYGGILSGLADGLRAEAQRLSVARDEEAEKNARLFALRLGQIGGLLNSHVHTSGVLTLIENVTHPRVQFTDFTFQEKDGLVSMSGVTEGYVSFGQQIIALGKHAKIRNLRVSDVSLNKKGQVVFGIKFEVEESVYR